MMHHPIQLIDPQRRIGAGVIALTGITQEMVESELASAARPPDSGSMTCARPHARPRRHTSASPIQEPRPTETSTSPGERETAITA